MKSILFAPLSYKALKKLLSAAVLLMPLLMAKTNAATTDLAAFGVGGWSTIPVASSNGNGTFTVVGPKRATINPPEDSFSIPPQTTQMLRTFPRSRILLDERFSSNDKKAEYAVIVMDVQGIQPGDAGSKAIPFPAPIQGEIMKRDQADETDMDAVKIEGPGYTRFLKRTYSASASISILWEFKQPDVKGAGYYSVYRRFRNSLSIQ